MDFHHIAVIDPALRIAEIDCYNNIVEMTSLSCTFHLPALAGTGSLERAEPELVKGIVVFGGGASLAEPIEWRLKLENWFQKCLDKKVPVFASCWGHQWIAHQFGGTVDKVPVMDEKFIGFRKIRVKGEGPFTASEGEVPYAHRYMVTQAPEGAEVFVESDFIENEGFTYKDFPIYTFQGHPEGTVDYLWNNNFQVSGTEDLSYGHGLLRQFLTGVID